MEPDTEVSTLGGVYFPSDCHLHPIHMMRTLKEQIVKRGGRIHYNHTFEGVVQKGDSCKQVIAGNQSFTADHFILAPGSWLQPLAGKFGISLLLQPGKGYSVTYPKPGAGIAHPAILIDDRVALTPLENSIRVGGTMELGGINHDINMKRVKPIIKAANAYYPGLSLPEPQMCEVWSGLRPCSPDGLPYIGKSPHHKNVWIAGGHAMIGISLAAATGKLISQMAAGKATEIPVEAFRINRWGK
jgi:D-amino-acid dehydrogenase